MSRPNFPNRMCEFLYVHFNTYLDLPIKILFMGPTTSKLISLLGSRFRQVMLSQKFWLLPNWTSQSAQKQTISLQDDALQKSFLNA